MDQSRLTKAQSLDDFVAQVASRDTTVRLETGQRLEAYILQCTKRSHLACREMGRLVECLLAWVTSSNAKVACYGFAIFKLLIQSIPDQMRVYSAESIIRFDCLFWLQLVLEYFTVVSTFQERLGDNNDQVGFIFSTLSASTFLCSPCAWRTLVSIKSDTRSLPKGPNRGKEHVARNGVSVHCECKIVHPLN